MGKNSKNFYSAIFIVAAYIFFAASQYVRADVSLSANCGSDGCGYIPGGDMIATASLDKATYAPGENMLISGSVADQGILGSDFNGLLQVSISGGQDYAVVNHLRTGSGSVNVSAPSTPGNYTANFKLTTYFGNTPDIGNIGSASISFVVLAPAQCDIPWGGKINNGQSITAYQNGSVGCGSSCASETRTCSNGTLSGSYANQNCSVQSCATYSWSVGAWGACSGGTCGNNNGTHTRTVVCQDNNGNTVADSNCSGVKPTTSEACTMAACTYSWKFGNWGNCNPACGPGTKYRSVWCEDSSGYVVTNSKCSGGAPIDSQSCNNGACPVTPGCTGVVPANASLVPNDDQGLAVSVERNLVSSDTPAKCEYTCDVNHIYDNTSGICKIKAPASLTATCTGSTISLSWPRVAGASQYYVRAYDVTAYAAARPPIVWGNCTGNDYCKIIVDPATTDSIAGVAGHTFSVWVHAYDSAGFSAMTSQSVSCSVPPVCTTSCGAWSTCTNACGGGTQTQDCTSSCAGSFTNSRNCNTQSCDRNWKEVRP